MATRIEPDTQTRLQIASATHGGFIVSTEAYDISTDRYSYASRANLGLLFAGSLADCLDFMRERMVTPLPASASEAP